MVFAFNNAHTISKTQAITLYKQNTTTLLTLFKASENIFKQQKRYTHLTFLLKMLTNGLIGYCLNEVNLVINN